jgi:hypothetical protein
VLRYFHMLIILTVEKLLWRGTDSVLITGKGVKSEVWCWPSHRLAYIRWILHSCFHVPSAQNWRSVHELLCGVLVDVNKRIPHHSGVVWSLSSVGHDLSLFDTMEFAQFGPFKVLLNITLWFIVLRVIVSNILHFISWLICVKPHSPKSPHSPTIGSVDMRSLRVYWDTCLWLVEIRFLISQIKYNLLSFFANFRIQNLLSWSLNWTLLVQINIDRIYQRFWALKRLLLPL